MNRKKKVKLLLSIAILLGLFLLPHSNVMAAEITTAEGTIKDQVLSISGTTESSVVAAVIQVYNSDETQLLAMQSTAVTDGMYQVQFADKKYKENTYVVKIADYSGGTYKIISVENEKITPTDTGDTKKSPQTGDSSSILLWLVIMGVPVVGISGLIIKRKREQKK